MTHASGLQYSYDDLDLVCCHGVDSNGPWMGAGASKQGRRTRCASMPEGCHQLPTEDLAQTREVTASVVNDETNSEQLKLMQSHVEVPLDLQEESVHGSHVLVDVDIPKRASESVHLQTTNIGNSEVSHCNSNSEMSIANNSCAAESSSEKTVNVEAEIGTERSQSHDICNDDNVFKSPHICREEQQCVPISSNNGPPLSECASEQPGKLPNHQETKESHTEGYSRPPEISEATQNHSSAAEREPQTDLPDVEEEKISTSGHADVRVTLPVAMLLSSVDMMDSGDVMSQTKKVVEPVVTSVVEEVWDKGESWNVDSADKLDGSNGPETLNENSGLKHRSRDIQEGEQDHRDCTGVLDHARGCEISYQTLLEQHNVEMTAANWPQIEESAQAESSEKAAEVRYEAITSSDMCFKSQCCSLTVEKLDTEKPIQTIISQYADQYLETTTSVSQPTVNRDESSVSKELACCEDQTLAEELENSCSKLDPIPEASHTEPDDTPVLDPQKNSNFPPNPDVQCSHVGDEHAATEKHTQNLPPCSAEVNDELSPERLHDNHETSGCYFSESPACEVADGQREHRRPAAASDSSMEETDEAAHTVIYSDTQPASPVLDGTNEAGDQKEDNVVKVRMRKVRLYLIKTWKGCSRSSLVLILSSAPRKLFFNVN